MTRILQACVLLVTLLGLPVQLHAHTQSYGYLDVTVKDSNLSGTFELALRDLSRFIDLDRNADGTITWGEVRTNEKEIAARALATIAFEADGAECKPQAETAMLDQHLGETYLVMPFQATCAGSNLAMTYNTLFDIDALHRGIVRITDNVGTWQFVAAPEARAIGPTTSAARITSQVLSFTLHGMSHLLQGYDHMLFLITLLLASAVNNRHESLRRALTEAAKVVTAFTLAHSVTLGLAATGVVHLPVTLTEAAIAMTIALAALNNLWPLIRRRIWVLALGFGLVHGLGFANVLADLGLDSAGLLRSLFAFNLGVELAQLVVVAMALPLLLMAARRGDMGKAFASANLMIIIIGCAWFSDRTLGTGLMPF